MLVPPHSGFGEDDEAGNPTDFLLVIGPLRTDLEMVGLVEIFQRSEAAPNVQQGYLRFLLQMCELAADFLKSHQLRHFSDRQVLWARLEDFTRGVHASLEPIADGLHDRQRGPAADRVRPRERGHPPGQPLHDRGGQRAGRVRQAIEHHPAAGPAGHGGGGHRRPGVVRRRHPRPGPAGRRRRAGVRRRGPLEDDRRAAAGPARSPTRRPIADEREDAEPPIGALIVEQIEDNRVAPALAQRVEVVCRHSSTALANAMEHQSLFLMPRVAG